MKTAVEGAAGRTSALVFDQACTGAERTKVAALNCTQLLDEAVLNMFFVACLPERLSPHARASQKKGNGNEYLLAKVYICLSMQ